MMKVRVFVCAYMSPMGYETLKVFSNREEAKKHMQKIWKNHVELYPEADAKRYARLGPYNFKIYERTIEVAVPFTPLYAY